MLGELLRDELAYFFSSFRDNNSAGLHSLGNAPSASVRLDSHGLDTLGPVLFRLGVCRDIPQVQYYDNDVPARAVTELARHE